MLRDRRRRPDTWQLLRTRRRAHRRSGPERGGTPQIPQPNRAVRGHRTNPEWLITK